MASTKVADVRMKSCPYCLWDVKVEKDASAFKVICPKCGVLTISQGMVDRYGSLRAAVESPEAQWKR